MKAKNKTTGEIVDIEDMPIVTYKSSDGTYIKTLIKNFTFIDAEKDYYTKLEHQYAGMAMQALMSKEYLDNPDSLVSHAIHYAHAIVEKLKEKEERK